MKTSTRRWTGAVLLVAGLVAVVVLQVSGQGLLGIDHLDDQSAQGTMVTLHWPLLPAGAAVFAGLLCLFLPARTNGHNHS